MNTAALDFDSTANRDDFGYTANRNDFGSTSHRDESDLSADNYQQSSGYSSNSAHSLTKYSSNNVLNRLHCVQLIKYNSKDEERMFVKQNGQPCHKYAMMTSAKKHSLNIPYTTAVAPVADTAIRVASMRIFTAIMLNAWRRRREDVKRLLVKVEELKKACQKSKNQIHVCNTLFRVEQKRNAELAYQLKCSVENVLQAKSSCETLTTSILSLKAERALFEEELANKDDELEALNVILSQTKAELYQSMAQQCKLRSVLCKKRDAVKKLENQKNKLINELHQLSSENRETENKYCKVLATKQLELERTRHKIHLLEEEVSKLRENSRRLAECTANDTRLRSEIHNLQNELATLQQALDNTLGKRLNAYWLKICHSHERTLYYVQMFLYCLLPAFPRPRAKSVVMSKGKYKEKLLAEIIGDSAAN